jgi:hypothetical protein
MKDRMFFHAVLSTESLTETTTEQGVVAVENGQPAVAAVFRRFIDAFITDWIHVCQYVSGKNIILYSSAIVALLLVDWQPGNSLLIIEISSPRTCICA